jgi:hypothetical protein
MGERERQGELCYSMTDFVKKYLPESYAKKLTEKPENPDRLGTRLARESLQKIRIKLTS